jgi:hypothetical protein
MTLSYYSPASCPRLLMVPARLRIDVPATASYRTLDASTPDGERPAVCFNAWNASVVRPVTL